MATLSVGEPRDGRGESEESGDDETKRKSLNGEVDSLQAPSTVPEESPVDMDTITLDPDEEDVDLVHCRIGKIEGLEVLRKAKTISLRQNLIKHIENLDSLVSLRELDLYDNQIRKLENLQALTELEQLDVSFNLLRKIEGLECLSKIKKLFLLHNKIKSLSLSLLNLVLKSRSCVCEMRELMAGGGGYLWQSMWILWMRSRSTASVSELSRLVTHTAVPSPQCNSEKGPLSNSKKLTTLDIAANRIKKIENISHLTELKEFWMNDNQIENWADLDELKNAKGLETVYLERNPLQKDPQYRRKIMLALPSVRQIDATFIRF
uniref:Protein phosphatase 1 regulatory subunit 7 n=1 Tax=Sinocyclocheilus grahami TaxID=75366 RepID=A0A672QY31_SINGR